MPRAPPSKKDKKQNKNEDKLDEKKSEDVVVQTKPSKSKNTNNANSTANPKPTTTSTTPTASTISTASTTSTSTTTPKPTTATTTASTEKSKDPSSDEKKDIPLEQKYQNPAEHNPEIQYMNVNILKNKKSLSRIEAERKQKREEKKIDRKSRPKQERFISAEKIVKDYRQKHSQICRMKRVRHKFKHLVENNEDEKQEKLIIAVRIRGFHRQTQEIKRILAELRLSTVRSAVFLKLNKKTLFLLKLVEPFVTYGTPTLRTVRDIITKRGYASLTEGKRVPLNDNTIIEQNLGEHNIVCLEDIIHEIWSCGPSFDIVNNFLDPFKVIVPPGGYPDKRKVYELGGDSGNRELDINQLVEKIT